MDRLLELINSSWILTAAIALQVLFRGAYFFYIGLAIRAARRDARSDKQARHEKWLKFKRLAAFILDGDGVALALVIALSINTLPVESGRVSIRLLGAIFILIGIAVKVSAYRAIGTRGYYWFNFFCDGDEREYVKRGIYKYLNNPMYGPGYLHVVGFPLLFLSAWGLAVGVFNWAVVWAFYFVFERSHTFSHYRSANAPGEARPAANR
jgi:protein-S-isoprenylcysteine O-methyltransferase Ste14